jgi:transketolase
VAGGMKMNIGEKAKEIRRSIIEMAHVSKGPHVGSALSCADILAVLYFQIMKTEHWEQRDLFILSKAHAAMALYAALAAKGIIDKKDLAGYYQNGGTLPGHLDKLTAKGVEVSAGALGHGFNIGIGLALGYKKQKNSRQVFVLIGDGESQEGSIWEGALFAPKLALNNLTVIMDYNNLQGYDVTNDICAFEPISAKWASFGWDVQEIDGHDYQALKVSLQHSSEKPRMIIAKTVKGRGVTFMENKLEWHYYIVTDELYRKALEELS